MSATPPPEMRVHREATMVDFKVRHKSEPRMASSQVREHSTSPSRGPTLSPRPDRSSTPSPSKSLCDADEILDFVRRHQRPTKNQTMEREPTMTWNEKRKPVLPGIPRSSKDHTSDNDLLKPGHSFLSRSVEYIPGTISQTLDHSRHFNSGKKPVGRVRSLPPIEVHLNRPSAPDPTRQETDWSDQWSDASSSASRPNSPCL